MTARALLPNLVDEALNPTPPDVWTPLGYSPYPTQAEFHALPIFAAGGPWDVLYGGAMGPGKSTALLYDGIDKAARHPGLEVWLMRDTYPSLQEGFITDLEKIGFAQAIGARWNAVDRILRLPNGSRLSFKHARNLVDATTTRGQCQYLIIDERSQMEPAAIDHLATRVRSGDPRLPVIGIRSGTNPGGPGHGRLKEEFIDPAPRGKVGLPILDENDEPLTLPDGRAMERYFLPATSNDNPGLDDSYYARFSMMTDEMRRAYRDGDWSSFPGQRFERFSPRIHMVRPFEISIGGVRRGQGIDWGGAAPFACVWGAIIGEQLVIYRELHEAGVPVGEQARMILAAEQPGERDTGRPVPAWVDPSCWIRKAEAPLAKPITPTAPPPGSTAFVYASHGLDVHKADNARTAGWALIDELLAPGDGGEPRLVIFDTCVNVLRSISNAPRSKTNPDDVDEKYPDDHAADALRYLCMGLGARLVAGKRAPRGRRDRVGAVTGGLAKARL